jgi:uncharacterized protein YbjT (DUF2867 family)
MQIAVLGASGYVGGRLVSRLLDAGHATTLLAREPAPLEDRFPAARVVRGDVLEPESLGPGLRGVEVIYYLVFAASRGETGAEERDLNAARTVAVAAASAGVGRIIYLGGLGGRDRGSSSSGGGGRSIGSELAGTGVPVTEFRTSVIIGSGSASLEVVRHLTERLPVLLLPRWAFTTCQPIGIRDVLDYLVEALSHPNVTGIVEIGGPDLLSYREMMQTYASVRGLRRLTIPVPVFAPRLSSWWLGLVTPVPAWIARPLVERLRDPLVVRDPGPAQAFAVRPMSYGEALGRALDRAARNEIETTWFDAYSVSHHGRATASLELGEGMLVDRRSHVVGAPREVVFAQVEQIGGAHGWPFANLLWRIRGLADRAVGGVGMRLGRRDPVRLRVGDALDFWRVEAIRRPELLRLRAEMRVPGRAWLQYDVEETPIGSKLTQTAFFEPKGIAGFAYWYILLPVHTVIFRRMVEALATRSTARSSVLPSGPDATA